LAAGIDPGVAARASRLPGPGDSRFDLLIKTVCPPRSSRTFPPLANHRWPPSARQGIGTDAGSAENPFLRKTSETCQVGAASSEERISRSLFCRNLSKRNVNADRWSAVRLSCSAHHPPPEAARRHSQVPSPSRAATASGGQTRARDPRSAPLKGLASPRIPPPLRRQPIAQRACRTGCRVEFDCLAKAPQSERPLGLRVA